MNIFSYTVVLTISARWKLISVGGRCSREPCSSHSKASLWGCKSYKSATGSSVSGRERQTDSMKWFRRLWWYVNWSFLSLDFARTLVEVSSLGGFSCTAGFTYWHRDDAYAQAAFHNRSAMNNRRESHCAALINGPQINLEIRRLMRLFDLMKNAPCCSDISH